VTYCHSHTLCHYTHTRPFICWIILCVHVWGEVVCEVFISTGISLLPLIPSPGSPLLFMFCTPWSHLHTERRRKHLVHPTPIHSAMQYSSHTLKHSPFFPVFTQYCALKQRSNMYSFAVKDAVVALWLWHRAECFLKPCMKNGSTNTRLFSLEMRGPLTGYRTHSLLLYSVPCAAATPAETLALQYMVAASTTDFVINGRNVEEKWYSVDNICINANHNLREFKPTNFSL